MKKPFIIFQEISASSFPDDADNWVELDGISPASRQRWTLWLTAPRYRFRFERETGNHFVECCPTPGIEQLKAYSQPEAAVADVYLNVKPSGDHPLMLLIEQSGHLIHAGGNEICMKSGELERMVVSGEGGFLNHCSSISKWHQESVGRWYDAACYILFCECLLGTLGLQVSDKVTTAIYRRERVLAQVAITQMKWVFDQPAVEYS